MTAAPDPRAQLARDEAECLTRLLTGPAGRAAVLVLTSTAAETQLVAVTSPALTADELAAFIGLLGDARASLAAKLAEALPDA